MGKYGDRIEQYETKELLGRGGFAKVYRAICRKSGLEVAIKMIDKAKMRERDMESRVKQEVAIHSQLRHPSILQFLAWFQDNDYVYLVLELCVEDLQVYLKRKHVLSEADACNIVRQLVEGLVYLHSHSIAHRDMSLANILLTNGLDVRISDFGLATQLQLDKKNMTMLGTPNYISPEVATSSSHGLETDVWGLGAMLFTMLVGTPPFDDKDGICATLNRVVRSEVDFPRHLSAEARDLITLLLKKNPEDRLKLEDILLHPFMRKNNTSYRPSSAASYRTDSNQRWLSSDSGVASSYLTSSLSLPVSQFDVNVSSSGRVPVLNGARRKNHYKSSESLSLLTSEPSMAPCCNGHVPSSNPRDCSHCNPSTNHGHICCGTSFHRYHQPPPSLPPPVVPAPKIPTPAITSHRLLPVRQKTKNVIVNVLDSGEVCLEFTRCRDGPERVYEVLRISQDGMRIVLYQPNHGKGVAPGSSPPPLPLDGSDSIFTYDTLPEKHWKKYSYAAKFVDLVKTKTPKVTFYSKSAKCFLMENSPNPDFEACFYEGGKITKSGNMIKLIESNGQSFNFESKTSPRLSASAQLMLEHFEKCLKHCHKIEQSMDALSRDSEDACFPVIVGRRPPEYMRILQSSSAGNKENLSPTAPSAINVRSMAGYEASVISASSKGGSKSSKHKKVRREFRIPGGGGEGTQFANGDITLKYDDGTTLLVNSSGNVTYTCGSGTLQYKQSDAIPWDPIGCEIRQKLIQMQEIVTALMTSSQ